MEDQGILKEAVHKAVQFTISLPPVTKKNSQNVVHVGEKCPRCKRGMKTIPLPSKPFESYQKNSKGFIPWDVEQISYPINVKALYYMPTRREVDLINLHEALHDVLVKHKLLSNDCCNIIVSTDGSRVLYDKENPRTEVYIEEVVGAVLHKEAK